MKTYMFPGQGSQRKGMGAGLFDEFPDLTATADAVLGYSVKELCLEDPRGELNVTDFTQPALYVVNALSYFHRRAAGEPAPDFAVGHSLGEYDALLAAGAFSFETGLELVRRRGELMGQASGGGMAAVLNASPAQIERILADHDLTSIDLANYNTASQLVISGPVDDIAAAREHLAVGSMLFVPLNTSAAFHSRYMEPARAAFAEFLEGFDLADPVLPVISNVTAEPYGPGQVKDLLARQIASPVRWSDSVHHLRGRGDMTFEEVGFGDVLTKLVRKIDREDAAAVPASAAVPVPAVPVAAAAAVPAAPAPVDGARRPGPALPRPSSASELVAWWNAHYPVGSTVRSKITDEEVVRSSTAATVLFGHRAAVYLEGYHGYFDLTEIEPVEPAAVN